MRKRLLMAVPVALTAVALAGGPALAHDCFVVNRNVTPKQITGEATGGWYALNVADAVASDVDAGLYTEEQGACLIAALPENVAVKLKGANGNGGVLMTNNPHESKLNDGKGVDNFEPYFAACGIDFSDE